jgi:predicted dehydrogenase
MAVLQAKITRVSTLRVLLTLLIVLQYYCEALFGRKRREKERKEREEAERLAKLVVIFGHELSKTTFYILTSVVAVGIAFLLLGTQGISKKRGNRPDVEGTLDVVVVGCGLPKKGMGWFHLTQLLEMERVNVTAVVEPFFMNPDLCPTPPDSWNELMTSLIDIGVQVVPSLASLTPTKKPTMCLIAGRTHDNPQLFHDCVVKFAAKFIYLEKPGAPTVDDLQDMQILADQYDTKVFIGYNKNVTPYIQKTIALARATRNSHVFFCHNNSYTQADLPEVFSRNPEGLLKNMAIHELALLVTYFDVKVDTISKFKVNSSKLFSEKISVWKPDTSLPNPEYITDFSRCAFKITLKSGRHVSVMADRCGGNVSFAVVKDEAGKEVERFEFPTPAEQAQIEQQVVSDPAMMPYFFVQRKDYLELKNRVINAVLDGTEAEGVATIQVGIEALKLAEFATESLNKALKAK